LREWTALSTTDVLSPRYSCEDVHRQYHPLGVRKQPSLSGVDDTWEHGLWSVWHTSHIGDDVLGLEVSFDRRTSRLQHSYTTCFCGIILSTRLLSSPRILTTKEPNPDTLKPTHQSLSPPTTHSACPTKDSLIAQAQ
jgi:hypothetical protein